MIGRYAFKRDTGEWEVHGNCYPIRGNLVELGGEFRNRSWLLPDNTEESLKELGIEIRVRVRRDAFCHEPEALIYVGDKEPERGYVTDSYCTRCDSAYIAKDGSRRVKVVEVEGPKEGED